MKPYRTVYVSPKFIVRQGKTVLRGWVWEAQVRGRVVASGDTVHKTIEEARAEGKRALEEEKEEEEEKVG